jgi:cytochrome c biogenesis protein CcmG/thiol:disulfide interchange protein DsbE
MSDTTLPQDPYSEEPVDLYGNTIDDSASPITEQRRRIFTPFGIVVIVASLLLIGVVAYGIYQNNLDTLTEGEAPNFEIQTYDGDAFQLADYRGEKVVVINFWQSNCPPCHDEAPMLVRVWEEYRNKGVVFVGVNAKDPDKLALDYIAQYDITYPNGLDVGDKIQQAYRTTGYPETFIIDRDGNITRHFPGPPSEAVLRAEIEEALALG